MDMEIFGIHLDKNVIANNWVPIALWALTTAILKILWRQIQILWSKIVLKFGRKLPTFVNIIIKIASIVLSALFSPLAKLLYLVLIGLIFPFILQSTFGFILAVFVALISWSFYSEITSSKSRKDPIFLDTFENLRAWNTISGNPRIDRNIGNPSPSLFLPIVANNPNNSCIEIRDLRFTNGIIEADIYLELGSLINIVFRADFSGGFNTARYYMARFDSRPNCYDSFLRNDGNGWNFIAQSNHTTTPELWQKIRVIVSGDSFQLYNLNGLLLSVNDGRYRRGTIGVFNEVTNVYVDNFSVKT